MHRRRAASTLLAAIATAASVLACSGGGDDGPDDAVPQGDEAEAAAPSVDADLTRLEELRAASTEPFAAVAGEDGRLLGLTGGFALPDAGVAAFLTEQAGLLGLDQPGIGIVAEGVSSVDGLELHRFGQQHRGIPVLGGDLVVVVEAGTVRAVTGGGVPPIGLDPRPGTTPAAAIAAAVAAVPAPAAARTAPQLGILPGAAADQPAVLVWSVPVDGVGGGVTVHVSAADSSVLAVVPLDPAATPDDLDVYDTNGAPEDEFVEDTLCSEEGDLYATEDGREGGVPFDQSVDDGWRAVLEVYDYYLADLGLDSYDGDGDTVQLRADVDIPGSNPAFWENWCEAIHTAEEGNTAEIIAHEYGHGIVDDRTGGGLVEVVLGTPDFSAMNESFADVLATGIEDDWIIAGRDLSDERRYTEDWEAGGEEHDNSRVLSHAWYRIARGDGTSIAGIGDSRVRELALTTVSMLPIDVRPTDLGSISYLAAILRGYRGDDLCTVARAWRFVLDVFADVPTCTLTDTDGDGEPDVVDDCDDRGSDLDHDGRADRCDTDDDGDHLDDDEDVCPGVPDPQQRDRDGDGVGDACDPDGDGDGVANDVDSCPNVPNPQQADPAGNRSSLADQDFDGIDDACDPLVDRDGDGIGAGEDNCPFDHNADQADGDGDGIGDACEIDTDGDGITDLEDACSLVADDGANGDGDLLGDACDPCPTGADQVVASQAATDPDGPGPLPPVGGGAPILNDTDGDGIPDGCDADCQAALPVTGIAAITELRPLGLGVAAAFGGDGGGCGDGGTFDLPQPCEEPGADGLVTVAVTMSELPAGARAGLLLADGEQLDAPPPGPDGRIVLEAEVAVGAAVVLVVEGGGVGPATGFGAADLVYATCAPVGDDPFPSFRPVIDPADLVPVPAPGSGTTIGTVGPAPTFGTVPPGGGTIGTVGPSPTFGTTAPPRTVGTAPPSTFGTTAPPGTVGTAPPQTFGTTSTTRPRFSTTTQATVGTVPPPTFGRP